MKFGTASNVDFAKVGEQSVKMERENNLREYKSANDLDTLPKFGAGSEFGRDQKEESRRKKYGIMLKRYNPEDQPWHLKIGSGKQAKRYKGVREGTISENTSYYIFTKAADGAFEAFPVEEWYNFSPIVKYKYLNSDEAEEEFSRRDKTLNYFSIMVKKRLKREEDVAEEDEEGSKGPKKTKKAKKDLILTDMDEWNDLKLSDDEDEDDFEGENDDDDTGMSKKKKKTKAGPKKKGVKNSKKNSDDEAVEESDEGDHDDREVDYMSDTGSDSSLSGPEADSKDKKYDEKGVDQEAGLRNILDSDAEEEEEEGEEEEPDKEEPEEEAEEKKDKKKGDDNSSSSSSDDDSDIEKDAKLASDIFLQQPKVDLRPGGTASSAAPETSATPQDKVKDKGRLL
ncbi:general transcription factor IIF subunit 1 [Elysia marginata]|uniref:Transcription initiation factor IIF subunit alpha n=1 Tax=Elysia marginata TaxID=1093978 RepID=A0AAV4IKL0_9GAST|nr:general transcription factor IIF subunit 1 [Elysia marginata]